MHFHLVYNSSCSGAFSSVNQCTEMLSLVSISDSSECYKTAATIEISRTRRNTEFSEIVVPVLRFIFSLSLSQNTFPNLWKQAAIAPVFKKGKTSSVGNYRPITIFPKIFYLSYMAMFLNF
jgi:hypothetical protein